MSALSTIDRRRRRLATLGAAGAALLSLSSVLGFGGTAVAADYAFQYWGNDSSCYAEAFCVNTNTVDACSTTCYMWFAPGGTGDRALESNASYIPDTYNNGERGRNRDTSGRKVCAYRGLNYSGARGEVPYFGVNWVPFPFTGLGSMRTATSSTGVC